MLLLPAGNPSPWTGPTGNNTYLLRGAVPTLIDAGTGEPVHLGAIERALDGVPLARILVTHSHPDHVKGIPALLARWPAAEVFGAGYNACADGETIAAGDTILRTLHTPGHAPDHFCFVEEVLRDVYCGDLARAGGTVVIPASSGGNLTDYLRSIQRVRALRPKRLLPGHGPVVEDPEVLFAEYVEHRAARERQVLDALRRGCTSAESIAATIYPGLHPAVVRASVDTVLAHLIKLRDEGRAVETGREWHLAPD